MLPGFEFIPIITSDSEFNDADFDHEIIPKSSSLKGKSVKTKEGGEDGGLDGGLGVDSDSLSGESTASDSSRSPPSNNSVANKSRDGKTTDRAGSARRRRGGGKGGGDGGGSRGGSRGPIKPVQRSAANARERARMRVLSKAFSKLKTSLPWVPPDTKLSKLDTLRLASSYISHLKRILDDDTLALDGRLMHPLNLTWPFAITNKPASSDDMENSNCDAMDVSGSSSNQSAEEDMVLKY
ncbi:uncharacterized protein [Diadema setosum]|uniref:uncharacterized protein n=1 Tax=Diadema setosum TaxID=31175 RepID=UPI003B3A0942